MAEGLAFLVYRDRNDRRHVRTLDAASSPLMIGRDPEADISLSWDEKVSRTHARLEMVGEDPAADWTLVDDGTSRNGSFVNGRRVRGRVRLSDGDTMSFGGTAVVFRAPGAAPATADTAGEPSTPVESTDTMMLSVAVSRAALSDSEYRVLAAVARLASDEQIARELFLGTETVQAHMQALFRKFGVESPEPRERRAQLVERARRLGILGAQPSDRPY